MDERLRARESKLQPCMNLASQEDLKCCSQDLSFTLSSTMQMEAGPSSLRHSSSHLDPLPVSHPLSIKLRTIFDNTSNFSAQSENTRVALEEIEQRYAKERIRSIEEEYDEEETLIDTEAARNNIAKDAQDSLEEAYSTFLGSLQIVDKASLFML